MSFVSGPCSVSIASAALMRSRMARASSARRIASCLRGGDDLAMAQREGSTPSLAPGVDVGLVVWPREMLCQFSGDVVEVQGCIEVVPAEHLQRRQVVSVRGLGEVGEADLALVALAVVRDEEQVVASQAARSALFAEARFFSTTDSGCGVAPRRAASAART